MKKLIVDYGLAAAAIALVLGPVILFLGRCSPAFFVDSIDLGDGALFQVGVNEAATFGRILGPYSRFGFNHPGPAPFYMFLPFFLAGGRSTGSLAVAAVFWNLFWLISIVWTIRKIWGHEGSLFAGLPLALLVLWMGPTQLFSIWNPSVGLLPLAASVVFLTAALSGKPKYFFAYVISVSLACQCHVFYLTYAVILTVIALSLTLKRMTVSKVREFIQENHRWSLLTAVSTFLVWAPVLIEEVTGSPGNLSLLIQHMNTTGDFDPQIGFLSTLGSVGEMFIPFQPNLGFGNPELRAAELIGFLLLTTIILGLVFSWMRSRKLPLLLVFSGAFFLVTWILQSQPGGATSPHLLWGGGITGFITFLSIIEIFSAKLMERRPWSVFITVGLIGILSFVSLQRLFVFPPLAVLIKGLESGSEEGKAIHRSVAYLNSCGEQSVWIHLLGSEAWVLGAGIVLEMKKNGIEAHVAEQYRYMFGRALTRRPNTDDTVLVVGPRSRIDSLVTQNSFAAVATTKKFGVASPGLLSPPFVIDISSDDALGLLRGGWAQSGTDGRWAFDRSSSLLIPARTTVVRVVISILPFKVSDVKQDIRVLDGTDSLLTSFQLKDGWNTVSVLLPASNTGTLLRFIPSYTRSPFELGRGKDRRQLSFKVKRLEVLPAE